MRYQLYKWHYGKWSLIEESDYMDALFRNFRKLKGYEHVILYDSFQDELMFSLKDEDCFHAAAMLNFKDNAVS